MTDQPTPRYTKDFMDSQILADTTPAGTGWTTNFEESDIARGVNGRVDNISLAYDMARKENARHAAERGLTLICRDGDGPRQSMDLDPEQPVLVDDDTLCYATGYEDNGLYEVRLNSVNGPYLHVKKVRAMVTANYKHLRALVTADSLADQLLRISSQSEDIPERRRFRTLSSQADVILTDLMKDKG